MRLLTYLELTRCTRRQLLELYQRMLVACRTLDPHGADYATAVMNIRNIRMFLARRDYRPSF